MALNEDTEALLLAYVYGELSASDARDFERRMDAGTPEAAELRAEVESLRASRELFGKDAAFGLRTGVDVPPAHLVDAIMNAEKLARPPAVRDAALARVAPPVEKSFTAKLSRWLLGGGVAVGAAAALFIVVTQGAQEPEIVSDFAEAKNAPAIAQTPPAEAAAEEAKPAAPVVDAPLGGVFGDAKLEPNDSNNANDPNAANGGEARSGAGRVGGDVAGALEDGFARAGPGGVAHTPATATADALAVPDNDAPAIEPAPESEQPAMNRVARSRDDGDEKKQPAYGFKADASKAADKADAQDEAKRDKTAEADRRTLSKAEELVAEKSVAERGAKAKAKEAAKDSAKEAPKASSRAEPRAGDDFGFDAMLDTRAPAKPAKDSKPDVATKREAKPAEPAKKITVELRDSEKAGMRASVGGDKGLGIATGAASSSGSSAPHPTPAPKPVATPAPTTTTMPTTAPTTPPADAAPSRAMSPPPAPPPPAATKSKPTSEADDEAAPPPPKVISREKLEEQRKNVRKKSAAGSSGKGVAQETERAKRLEQANIALASAQREMAAKRWLSAYDQMALAESLDLDRALGATPLVGQMRALVELKRPVDAVRVARRLGRWDVKAFDVVPGLLLGAQVAEQVGDDRLARELWTRLLEVPSERAKARAALDRMEGAKALRRQQYDSDAAEAPAAAAPAESESSKE